MPGKTRREGALSARWTPAREAALRDMMLDWDIEDQLARLARTRARRGARQEKGDTTRDA